MIGVLVLSYLLLLRAFRSVFLPLKAVVMNVLSVGATYGILVLVYALSGFFAGLAALLLAGRTDSGFPNAGIGAELDAIAAVIIGGASFFGGVGTVWGTLIGALIMGVLRNGLTLLNVSPNWQKVVIGVVIVAAVWIDVLRQRTSTRRRLVRK